MAEGANTSYQGSRMLKHECGFPCCLLEEDAGRATVHWSDLVRMTLAFVTASLYILLYCFVRHIVDWPALLFT